MATFSVGTGLLIVRFDRPLLTAVLNPGNWFLRALGVNYAGGPPCNAAGSVVTCTMAAGLPFPGPDVVNYGPPPFDAVSAKDQEPVEAFTDFPLTVGP